MGSCISKCKPNKKRMEDCVHVQDKLIISQNPIPSIPTKMTTMPSENSKKPPSPPPSNSSSSSFSCSTNTSKCTMTSSSSSLSSSSCYSSLMCAKDRSFSNEFLRYSCESANKIQYYPQSLDPSSLVASPLVKTKHSVQENAINHVPTHKKRARASSPTFVRQKSFRKEQNADNPMPNRALRSPSPSRRFNNGDNGRYVTTNGTNESNSYRRQVLPKGNNGVNSSCTKTESFRATTASPNRDLTMDRKISGRKRDALISKQVSAKIDIKEKQDMDIVMEDINNPLIALDCFIFL